VVFPLLTLFLFHALSRSSSQKPCFLFRNHKPCIAFIFVPHKF
jgi:hypothetical protein